MEGQNSRDASAAASPSSPSSALCHPRPPPAPAIHKGDTMPPAPLPFAPSLPRARPHTPPSLPSYVQVLGAPSPAPVVPAYLDPGFAQVASPRKGPTTRGQGAWWVGKTGRSRGGGEAQHRQHVRGARVPQATREGGWAVLQEESRRRARTAAVAGTASKEVFWAPAPLTNVSRPSLPTTGLTTGSRDLPLEAGAWRHGIGRGRRCRACLSSPRGRRARVTR
jgi:hypothetical protein